MQEIPVSNAHAGIHRLRQRRYWPLIGMLVGSTIISGLLIGFDPTESLGRWGYPGVFFAMLLGNVTVVLPAISQLFLIETARDLNPWLLGLVGGVGAIVGELSGYFLGRSGRRAATGKLWANRYETALARYFGPALFIFAITPLPFDLAGIIAGASRYPLWKFVLWAGLGKIASTMFIAVVGAYIVDWVIDGARDLF
jgi:membrane protein DedA with SNARE-associated domain